MQDDPLADMTAAQLQRSARRMLLWAGERRRQRGMDNDRGQYFVECRREEIAKARKYNLLAAQRR